MKQISENKMGSAPLLPLILSMSLPAMFSMLVQSLYNVVDSYFVAKVSQDALTAVSLAYPIQMLMISVSVGTGTGLNSLISRRLGEQRKEEAESAATHGVVLGLFSWIVFALIGIFGTKAFFHAFTDDSVVSSMGCSYLYIVTICSFGVFIEMNFEKTLQATGNMIYPMISQLIGAVTNIILDPIMIFGLLGFPKMGVAGAAVATVIGQIFAMIFVTYIALAKSHAIHISFKNFKIKWSTIRNIYAVGIPAMIMQAIGSVLLTAMNLILISFHQTAVAVYGVYFKLQSFVFMPVFGLSQGLMPIMGYNFGAGSKKRLLGTLKIGSLIALVIMLLGTAVFMVFPDKLLNIFEADALMLEVGIPALRTISLCFPAAAFGIIFSTLFQAVGKGSYSLTISVLRQLVIIVPVAYLLSKLGLNYVWYAFPIAEVFSLLASIVLFAVLNGKVLKNLHSVK